MGWQGWIYKEFTKEQERKILKMIKIRKHKGLGDTVEAVTKMTGIQQVVKAGAKAFNQPMGS